MGRRKRGHLKVLLTMTKSTYNEKDQLAATNALTESRANEARLTVLLSKKRNEMTRADQYEMDRLAPPKKALKMNTGNMGYNAQPLYGKNDWKGYCRLWQRNHECRYGVSCRYSHETDPEYKGPVDFEEPSGRSSSSKVYNTSGDQDTKIRKNHLVWHETIHHKQLLQQDL